MHHTAMQCSAKRHPDRDTPLIHEPVMDHQFALFMSNYYAALKFGAHRAHSGRRRDTTAQNMKVSIDNNQLKVDNVSLSFIATIILLFVYLEGKLWRPLDLIADRQRN